MLKEIKFAAQFNKQQHMKSLKISHIDLQPLRTSVYNSDFRVNNIKLDLILKTKWFIPFGTFALKFVMNNVS